MAHHRSKFIEGNQESGFSPKTVNQHVGPARFLGQSKQPPKARGGHFCHRLRGL